MENSLSYEMLKALKVTVKIMAAVIIIELGIIAYMGFLLYDSQFEYYTDQVQELDNTSLENSSLVQN
jgi:hypothetical protein